MNKFRSESVEKDAEKTVGACARELMMKGGDPINVIDMQRAMQEEDEKFQSNVLEATSRGVKQFDGDFYVCCLFKKEVLMPNVLRTYFFPRKSCPTPTYDQGVWSFHRDAGHLELLWVLPNQLVCMNIPPTIDPKLREYIREMESGELLKLAKRLNEEDRQEARKSKIIPLY